MGPDISESGGDIGLKALPVFVDDSFSLEVVDDVLVVFALVLQLFLHHGELCHQVLLLDLELLQRGQLPT